jgi:hypothetical protein
LFDFDGANGLKLLGLHVAQLNAPKETRGLCKFSTDVRGANLAINVDFSRAAGSMENN